MTRIARRVLTAVLLAAAVALMWLDMHKPLPEHPLIPVPRTEVGR